MPWPGQPRIVRTVHHPTNLGYGAALRSGFRVARFDWVGFTDGDRQFAVADLGRLTARIAEPVRFLVRSSCRHDDPAALQMQPGPGLLRRDLRPGSRLLDRAAQY